MNFEVLKYLLILGFPLILSKTFKFFFSKSEKVEKKWKRPYTSLTLFVRLVVAFFVLTPVFKGANYFQETRSPFTARGFELRNRLRLYFIEKAKGDTQFERMFDVKDRLTERDDDKWTKEEFITDDRVNEEFYNEKRALMIRLKSASNRKLYSRFGESFVDCKFCTEETDYHFYSLPPIVFHYVLFILAVGLITYIPWKSGWLNISLLFSLVLFLSELAIKFDLIDLDFDLFVWDVLALEYQKSATARCALLGGWLVVVLIFDNGFISSKNEKLDSVLQRSVVMLNQMQALALQRSSVMSDPRLCKEFVDYYKANEAVKQLIMSNPEMKKHQMDLLHKYSLEKMLQDANGTVTNIMESVNE